MNCLPFRNNRVIVAQSFFFCIVFCGPLFILSLSFFSFGYCIVCPFLDLRLLTLWYLHTLIENQLFCIVNIISYMPKLNAYILVNMTMSLDDYVKLIINLHVFEDFVLSLEQHILS